MYNEIQSPAQVPVKYVSVQCKGGLLTVLYGICCSGYMNGTGAEWPFNFLPEIEFWALTHIKFQSNSKLQNE